MVICNRVKKCIPQGEGVCKHRAKHIEQRTLLVTCCTQWGHCMQDGKEVKVRCVKVKEAVMKPILIFNATEEHRQVKQDEWYRTDNGLIYKWADKVPSPWEYDIYTLTEIERPEGAIRFDFGFITERYPWANSGAIIISKPKVKKWKYQFEIKGVSGVKCETEHLTEEQKNAFFFASNNLTKIEGTEIEE